MKELQYKKFSLKTHTKSQLAQQPSSCQFELTFGCGLHCRHCYCDCYNQPHFLKKELSTPAVKSLLDRIRKLGVIWLCFTGGDPLTRKDFGEIYSYAKKKGFLISVFISGYSLNKQHLELFKRQPPFVIEMTLNAVREQLYERISGVRGSFAKAIQAIQTLTKEKIPLKIKTLVTKDNFCQVAAIKKFLSLRGFSFFPDYHLFASLNGDTVVCQLRASVGDVMVLIGKEKNNDRNCGAVPKLKYPDSKLFWCALGAGQKFHVDPYGNLFLCPGIRSTSVSIVRRPISPVFKNMLQKVRESTFSARSKCADCRIRSWCLHCPGKAYAETRDMESPLDYYCRLTKEFLAR